MNYLTFSLLLSTSVVTAQQKLSPIVATIRGPVRGKLVMLRHTPLQPVYEFTGIPFAEPPIGNLRFRKPVPIAPWNTTLEATNMPPMCLQSSGGVAGNASTIKFAKGVTMSEDCLYLNLWVPRTAIDNRQSKQSKTLAVMVFIHGGAFMAGSSMQPLFNGSILAAHSNVIVASVQYRLGSLGFARFDEQKAPGNQGLWDQLEGLKFIHENIASFGGNASLITIFGQSAGAVSVGFHLLSPASRPYFSRAILESGSALAPWGYRNADEAERIAEVQFETLSLKYCSNFSSLNSSFEKLECLRSIKGSAFIEADLGLTFSGFGLSFVPTLDGDFLPKNLKEKIAQGDFAQVPTMLGANRDEGSQFLMMNPSAMELLPSFRNPMKTIENFNITHFKLLLQQGSYSVFTDSAMLKNHLLMGAVQMEYWPRKSYRRQGGTKTPSGRDIIKAAVDAGGDYAFTCPTYIWASLASNSTAKKLPIYAYFFNHRRRGAVTPDWLGVMHGDELNYVFGEPFAAYAADNSMGYNSDDRSLSRIMMTYWSNFAKFGDPNVNDGGEYTTLEFPLQLRKWPLYTDATCTSGAQFLEINALTQVFVYGQATICGLKDRECAFWNDFYLPLENVLLDKSKQS